ncbi:MAG: leucyl aminopeptidase family protein [Jatrophihabitantaceae bacterium]
MLDVHTIAGNESVGPLQAFDARGGPGELRVEAGRLARAAGSHAVLDVSGLAGERLTAFVEGLALGGHRFSLTSTTPAPQLVELTGVIDADAVAAGLRNAAAGAWARELANMPTSTKTPAWLGAEADSALTPLGVDVAVHDESWLAEQGFGGILAVGAGSKSPPRLIQASWRPRSAPAGRHIVLVGKGITFDTGGINLKPGASMRSMQTDMSGGAAVLAALRLVAELRLPIRITALVPSAENSFSGSAMHPGDVVRHYGGRTSEIGNTDAEGRLVLADALAYAVARLKPTALVDIATLTGAMKLALGLRVGGVFGTNDRLVRELIRAGEATGEPLWRMPLADDYAGTLDSSIADANNAPGNPGAITAALFLRPFTGDVPWAHLDVAGPARAPADDGILARGATGFGARLLARYLAAQ